MRKNEENNYWPSSKHRGLSIRTGIEGITPSRSYKKEIYVERNAVEGLRLKLNGSPNGFQQGSNAKYDHKTAMKKSFDSRTINKSCSLWYNRGNNIKPPYYLTAVLLVRIYESDLAKLSSREMIQWFQYLRYAGFEHLYVYDAYVEPSESQRDVMAPFIQSGFATYIDWSEKNPYTIQGTQVAAYQHCNDHYGKETTWMAAIDIDEYPFSPRDHDEDFMRRFLNDFTSKYSDVSEITMKNYLFLGKPISDTIEPLLMARIRRRTDKPANALVKPIYRPEDIMWAQVHHNDIKKGRSMDSPENMLRLNHYWGARLQDWGEDTPKILDITEPDYSIETIVKRIKSCASYLGEQALYVQRWA